MRYSQDPFSSFRIAGFVLLTGLLAILASKMSDDEEYEYDYGSDGDYDYGSDGGNEDEDKDNGNDELIEIENSFYGMVIPPQVNGNIEPHMMLF